MKLREERGIFSRQHHVLSSNPCLPQPMKAKGGRPRLAVRAGGGVSHLSSRLREQPRRSQQLSAPVLLPAAFAAETRQGGAAGSLWRHGLRTDSKAFIYFTESSDSKEQLQDRLLFHPPSGTLKKFSPPNNVQNSGILTPGVGL